MTGSKQASKVEPFISMVRLESLVPHERIDQKHLSRMLRDMRKSKRLRRPPVVHDLDDGRYLIADGHHRVAALKELGCVRVPVRIVNYFSPHIRVRSWNDGQVWGKKKIMDLALRGELMDPKTTQHRIVVDGKEYRFQHFPFLEPRINCPIDFLRGRSR